MKENAVITELKRQKDLLLIEYEEEKKAFTKITEFTGIEKIKARGNAWTDIKLNRCFYNSLNQRILEIQRPFSQEDEMHNFEHGRPVMFFSYSEGINKFFKILFQGEVSYVDGERMLVIIPDSTEISLLNNSERTGIMLSFDETSFRMMFAALDKVINAKGRLAEIRDSIFSGQPFSTLSLPPIKFPYLNYDQEDAVNNVLRAKDVFIVHGPPGTGKTTTLVEAIYETLRREPQVLVCAQSNMAVDWISEKLVDRGLQVVRIGNPSRVNDKMLSFTYERRFESHPDYTDLWGIRKAIRQLYKDRNKTDSWHQKIDRMKSRATELEIRINNDILNSTNVIASTLVGSGNRILSGMRFSSLFIDEASQALEAATWIPVNKAGRVILAGDHCQLPPTVKSQEALKGGLGKSLMEKIVEKHPEAVKMLSIQYRMNEDIMKFSSEWFYKGNMKSSPEIRDRSILDFDIPIEWIDTSILQQEETSEDNYYDFKEKETGNFGKINPDEALLTLSILQSYIERIGLRRFIDENLDVGIISPYRAQTEHLRRLINQTPFFKPVKKKISVNTVDGFQGQERDIIIISLVRSNQLGSIGFLKDLRRMNVAMTRARTKLIIIGDSNTLTKHKFYKSLLNYIYDIRKINKLGR